MSGRLKNLWEKLAGFRYILLIAAVGLALLLWPDSGGKEGAASSEETRVAALLAQIEGVGQTQVLLSDTGAVVVCDGAKDASVRLAVTEAVRCYTGLGANEVTIFKME